jgi:hypothetical protein
MANKLVRAFQATGLRMEKREDGEGHTIVGHAAVFNSLSEELWPGVREKIMPGAFSGVLDQDVRLLQNHDPNYVFGRTKSKTLKLSQDAIGLFIKADVPDTQAARDLGVLMERGDVDSMSFAFEVDPADVRNEKVDENNSIDVILRVKRLWDVSVVTYPAYPAASASFRAFEPPKDDAGISKSEPAPEGGTAKGGAGDTRAEGGTSRALELATARAQLERLNLSVEEAQSQI